MSTPKKLLGTEATEEDLVAMFSILLYAAEYVVERVKGNPTPSPTRSFEAAQDWVGELKRYAETVKP